MKKILMLTVLVLCGCRSLPADMYFYETKEKNDNYRYTFQDKYLSIFEEEVKKALRTTGPKMATVKISDQVITSGSADNVLWTTPSVLTLGVINLVGWPFYHASKTVRVKAEVYNNAGKLMETYTAIGSDWSMAACYYGYDKSDAGEKAYNGAYRKALDKVLAKVNNDKELYYMLKGNADKALAEKRKKEAEEKAKQERIEKHKKKHLDDVMSDVGSL